MLKYNKSYSYSENVNEEGLELSNDYSAENQDEKDFDFRNGEYSTEENYNNYLDYERPKSHRRDDKSSWNALNSPENVFRTSSNSGPLIRARNLANAAVLQLQSESEDSYKENFFEPPNSPKRRPIDYLKELADSEASKMRNEQFNEKIRRQRLGKAEKNEMTAIVDNEVKSFNDFDEGIFVFNPSTRRYMCPDQSCGKEFPSLSRIKRHFIIHTDIKPFKCQNKECNRRFSRKDNMLQHFLGFTVLIHMAMQRIRGRNYF